MKAIIIDDEKKGREILQKLLENYCPQANVVAISANADEGYEAIMTHHPEVVFLDIEMPGGNGFDLLEKFDDIFFRIIFTTAYDSYALKAIKYHAFDYLLKPIDIDELKTTMEKLVKNSLPEIDPSSYKTLISSAKLEMTSRLSLPVKDGIVFITVSDIVRIEADGGYSVFYTGDAQKYMVSKNLKEYEDILPPENFLRVHKSHLVNMGKVKKFLRTDGYFVEMEDGAIVEIARRKKDEFLQRMTES